MPLLDRTGLVAAPSLPETVIAGDTPPLEAFALAADAPLVVIDFASGGDGRGFSLARSVREQGFKGRLHTRGPLIPEQYAFAIRLGIDAVEVTEERLSRQPVEHWLAALAAFSFAYQGLGSIFDRRRAERLAA